MSKSFSVAYTFHRSGKWEIDIIDPKYTPARIIDEMQNGELDFDGIYTKVVTATRNITDRNHQNRVVARITIIGDDNVGSPNLRLKRLPAAKNAVK